MTDNEGNEEVPEQPEQSEEARQKALADAVETDALFAEDLEPVTVHVPKHEGCYFTLQPLDGMALTRLYGTATPVTQDAATGKLTAGALRVDAFTRELVANTVVDFVLRRRSRVKGSDEYVWSEVRASAQANPKLRAQYIRDTLCPDPATGRKGLAPGLWHWLVECCQKVNGAGEGQAGN